MTDKFYEDPMVQAVDLVNEVLKKHSQLFNPHDFPPDQIAHITLGVPAMIAADIIEQLAVLYDKPVAEIYEIFISRLKSFVDC